MVGKEIGGVLVELMEEVIKKLIVLLFGYNVEIYFMLLKYFGSGEFCCLGSFCWICEDGWIKL